MNGLTVLSRTDIQLVVKHSLSALSKCDLKACVVGSVAAQLHGIEHRDPKDVDLLILNAGVDQDAEEVKRRLVEVDSEHFSLTPSRVAGATHQILWCTLGGGGGPGNERIVISRRRGEVLSMTSCSKFAGNLVRRIFCKVDILVPSQLYMTLTRMPEVLHVEESSDEEVTISYVPLCTLLMLKLRAWEDHCLPCANEVKHGKIPEDEDDIREILGVARMEDGMGSSSSDDDEMMMWVLGGFGSWREAEESVRRFVRKWPDTASAWRKIHTSK